MRGGAPQDNYSSISLITAATGMKPQIKAGVWMSRGWGGQEKHTFWHFKFICVDEVLKTRSSSQNKRQTQTIRTEKQQPDPRTAWWEVHEATTLCASVSHTLTAPQAHRLPLWLFSRHNHSVVVLFTPSHFTPVGVRWEGGTCDHIKICWVTQTTTLAQRKKRQKEMKPLCRLKNDSESGYKWSLHSSLKWSQTSNAARWARSQTNIKCL